MRIAYLFCIDPARDRFAPLAWRAALEVLPVTPAGFAADGGEVMKAEDGAGNQVLLVPTSEVVSHDLDRYSSLLARELADCSLAGIVNWHEGGNAPDKIFCVHTNGDVPTGCFPKADPNLTSRLLRSLAKEAVAAGLTDWKALPEATHFSGVVHGTRPEKLLGLPMPLVDVEVGSTPASWSSRLAAEAMAKGLWRAFEQETPSLPVVLFAGGMHFEPSLAEGVIGNGMTPGGTVPSCSFGHVLPNQWIDNDGYLGAEGADKLRAAILSFSQRPDILVFHDNLKGPYKSVVRAVANEFGIPSANHRILRRGAEAVRRGA
jgi:D-tyrosyl-tRNA(Tyr) deacylase